MITALFNQLFNQVCRFAPSLKVNLWKQWYQFLAKSYQIEDWKFMNYGYTCLDTQDEGIDLADSDDDYRYSIQLYHHVATSVDLERLEVLEVGSGRGGGANYIKRYLNPRKVVGLDLSENAVDFCNQYCAVDGLSFQMGNAESLPFEAESFDVVVNVESSHCYASFDRFVSEVKRVLRQDGYFLFADFRNIKDISALKTSLDNSGLALVNQTDITPNIVRALELDDDRKIALISKIVHKPLVNLFLEFAGTQGSKMYRGFKSREIIYQSFVLQK
jgi:SAM-dependent methyltransferase